MEFTQKIKFLMVLGLVLQFSMGFADGSSLINAVLKSVEIALDDPQINVDYQLPRVNYRNDIGPTALILAAASGHKEIVKLLLDAGAHGSNGQPYNRNHQ